MASCTKTAILTVSVLITAVIAVSCMKVRSPGIMPPIEGNALGEWTVVGKVFSPDRTDGGEEESQLGIILKYTPGEDDRRIATSDIIATFDEKRIPFTFKEEEQVLEVAISAVFGPSIVHVFAVVPKESSTLSFPSFALIVD